MQDVNNRENMRGGGGLYGILLLSTQLFCKSKNVLKISFITL